MTNKEKANIILMNLDVFMNINWNFEEIYIKAIIKGLEQIEELKKA